MHPSSVNHQRFTSAAESGRQVCGYPVVMVMRIAASYAPGRASLSMTRSGGEGYVSTWCGCSALSLSLSLSLAASFLSWRGR